MRLRTFVHPLALAGGLAILACTSDPCVTCAPTEDIPNISGPWTVSYSHSENGPVAALVEKFLIIDVAQQDSTLVGHLGGTVTTCTAQTTVVCTTNTLYATAVMGRVHGDSSITLSWLEDTTLVEMKGKVGATGLSGGATGTTWRARTLSIVPIALARGQTGDTVTVRGVITVDEGAFYPGNVVYVQDGTAGIEVVGLGTGPPMSRGDSVLIRGVSALDIAGESAIVPIAVVPFARPPEAVKVGSGTVPAPKVVSIYDLFTREYEGSLVTLPSVRLRTLVRFAGQSEYGMWLQVGSGPVLQGFVHQTVAASLTYDSWTVGQTYDLTGIVGFGVNLSSASEPLLQLRGPNDRVSNP